MLKIVLLLMTLSLSSWAMHSFELNINEKDLEAKVQLDMGQFNRTVDPDTTFIGFSYLAPSTANSSLGSEPNGLMRANFLLQGSVNGFEDLVFGLGAKFVYTSLNEKDFFAIPFGLLVKYRFPFNMPIGFFIAAEGYYSPEVLSFDNAKNYTEGNAYLEIQLIDRASILGGYRNVGTNYIYSNSDIRVNESLYVGFKFLF